METTYWLLTPPLVFFQDSSRLLLWQSLCSLLPGPSSISSNWETVVTPDPQKCVGPWSEVEVA